MASSRPDYAGTIKREVPILEFLERNFGLRGQQKGNYFQAHCFNAGGHKNGDASRSMSVREDQGTYHCFGCGIHGTVIDAYAFLNGGISAADAIIEFARELNILEERVSTDAEDILNYAAGRYANALKRKPDALEYLKSRGLTDETIEKFELGYCWGTDLRGLDEPMRALAIKAGLAWPPREGDQPGRDLSPQMSGRITFPIKNRSGQVVGFGGRVVPGAHNETAAKYVNTSATDLFKKSELLYGLNLAKGAIRKEGFALIVEGYMDVIGLHQAKVENAVAVMSAGLNSNGYEKLWALTDTVVFCLDPDLAGQNGTARSIRAAGATLTDDRQIKVMFLESDQDPDEYVLEHGKERLLGKCAQALSLAQFLIGREAEQANLFSPEDRARFISQAKLIAAEFPNAPEIQGQIVAEARAVCSAAVADAALNFTGMDVGANARELSGAIRLMQRQLEALQAAEAAIATAAADSAPEIRASRRESSGPGSLNQHADAGGPVEGEPQPDSSFGQSYESMRMRR